MLANRLQAYIKNNHLSNQFTLFTISPQDTPLYRIGATESIFIDIIVIIDKGEVTTLSLFDLSTAFNTIDHATSTNRLSEWYGISGLEGSNWIFFLFSY